MASSFTQTNLVSDIAGVAKTTDPNLVNPWGLAFGPGSGFWVANQGTGIATVYDGNGIPLPPGTPLVVTIPTPGGTGKSHPTGQVGNATQGFNVSSGGKTAPSNFIFATEEGTIAGWSFAVDTTQAFITVDNSASGAVYKGLALGFNHTGTYIYATNFNAGTVDVFDTNFAPVKIPGAFKDSGIPAGFAPFGIQAINGNLYVTYARQDAAKEDDVAGAGNGFVNVFDTEGHLLKRFASQGQLNSPWGIAWAPLTGYGDFSNALLVGNFGDGTINAYDFDDGAFLGKFSTATGQAIVNSGLWALSFGSGAQSTSPNTLYFTAGPDNEQHGLFGSLSLDPTTTPTPEPVLTDPNLGVTTIVTGLAQPTNMAFLGAGDLIVLEKASGKIQHVVNGTLATPLQFGTPGGATLANLPVNNASERGLLGVAIDPAFATNRAVYLYWTESSTGAVSGVLGEVGNANSPFPPGTASPLGNRVDRFILNSQTNTMTFDRNLITLRALQQDNINGVDASQPPRGNHDAGDIVFGPDGKLYIMIGDVGRRGQMQNFAGGWKLNGQSDDQFGGPAPDNNHLTGVILRLNPDGTTPTDNPFANVTTAQIGQLEQQFGVVLTDAQLAEVTANIRKIFSYGRRNGFGLAFDPITGALWESENADEAFDELNRVTAGSNGGWTQIMGPVADINLFKTIESTFTPIQGNLGFNATDPAAFIPATQQIRWNPSNTADTPEEALSRLFALPGSQYQDPQFSWLWAVAPAGIGFAGNGLGPEYAGDLFVGGSRTSLHNGYLLNFNLNTARDGFTFNDPRLADKVDNNEYKFDEGESSSLTFGRNFGIVTDVQTGPDGNLYVVSLSNGAIYRISRTTPIPTPAPTAPPQLIVSAISIQARPGRRFQGPVATFVDPVAGAAVGDFTATIVWGDGTASSGTIATGSGGSFVVSGVHRYRRRGTFALMIAVADTQGESGVATGTATVARRRVGQAQARLVARAIDDNLGQRNLSMAKSEGSTAAKKTQSTRGRALLRQAAAAEPVRPKHVVHDLALASIMNGRYRRQGS